MALNDMDWATDEITFKQKKLSREEKKNQQAMKLFSKLENTTQKTQSKPKIQQAAAVIPAKPKKKLKVDVPLGERQLSSANPNQFESSSVSEPANKEKGKSNYVINNLYILNDNEDIFSHLVDYENNQRAKYIDSISSTKKDIKELPSTNETVNILSKESLEKTKQAFARIQNKFQEMRNKLSKPNSKEHKEFSAQYLTLDYLTS